MVTNIPWGIAGNRHEMTPFENYLTRLREIRSSGEAVDETSYYDALANFFNEIGQSLKPKVRSILQFKNCGACNPDGGLFTPNQRKVPSLYAS